MSDKPHGLPLPEPPDDILCCHGRQIHCRECAVEYWREIQPKQCVAEERPQQEETTANQLIEEYRVETGHLTAYWQSAERRAVAAEQKLQALKELPRWSTWGTQFGIEEGLDVRGPWVKASDRDAILEDTNE